jgi:hypothetical protein
MKHELLQEVWRVRDQLAAECGHDLKRLASLVRKEEKRSKLAVTRPASASNRPKRRRTVVAL